MQNRKMHACNRCGKPILYGEFCVSCLSEIEEREKSSDEDFEDLPPPSGSDPPPTPRSPLVEINENKTNDGERPIGPPPPPRCSATEEKWRELKRMIRKKIRNIEGTEKKEDFLDYLRHIIDEYN